MRRIAVLVLSVLMTIAAYAGPKEEGDSIYEHMVELSVKGESKPLLAQRDQALRLFADNQQWQHYYIVASLCIAAKVQDEGQTMTGLRECRKLYEYARDNHHEFGRGIVLAQIGWLYGFIGDHEEGVRQMQEAFRLLSRHKPNREGMGLLYYYAYGLELTGKYEEEARILTMMKPLILSMEWSDTTSVIYQTYRDNLLNAEALLEVRRGHMDEAARLVGELKRKIAANDEHNVYEALRAIAEYHKAMGEYQEALATTDSMMPLAQNSGLQWGLGLLRTEILRNLGRSDEAYDLLRPMIDLRSNDRLGQLRQHLNEMEAMTEIDEMRIHRKIMQFWYAVFTALGIILSLTVYAVIRHRAARKLKQANTQLREAYGQLEATTTAKERIESELRIARDIQRSMLPSEFPQCDRLNLYGSMNPAREVGGDLYDILLIDCRHLYFCVGDVSGKGVPASLFMAQAIRLFRTLAKLKAKPAEIATYMNKELSDRNESGMFVTMFMGVIDIETGHLEFCNCGHNPPVLGCGTPQAHFLQMESNAPIGLWDTLEYKGESIDDMKGQTLFIYTDGLNEAENSQKKQFGDDHLLTILQAFQFDTSQQLIGHITSQVEEHRQGAEPNDDLTMLCIMMK